MYSVYSIFTSGTMMVGQASAFAPNYAKEKFFRIKSFAVLQLDNAIKMYNYIYPYQYWIKWIDIFSC